MITVPSRDQTVDVRNSIIKCHRDTLLPGSYYDRAKNKRVFHCRRALKFHANYIVRKHRETMKNWNLNRYSLEAVSKL